MTPPFRLPNPILQVAAASIRRLFINTARRFAYLFAPTPSLGLGVPLTAITPIIAVLPDGRRVYEFHPWEKKLSLMDTYVYTDVSIHDYLQRLKAVGENPADYRTVWYHY
jgi:lysine 2,3-aminomutase